MPTGFIGNASKKYLTTVKETLNAAHEVHSRDPYGGATSSAAPALPNRENHNTAYTPDTANSGGYVTGVGNDSNIVVDEDAYAEILRKIRLVDSTIAESLYNLAGEIEEMCRSIYVVPSTLPKYLRIVEKVKSSLGEFQSLSEEAETNTQSYVKEITSIDNR